MHHNIALSIVEVDGFRGRFIDFLILNPHYRGMDVVAIIVHLQVKGEALLDTGNGSCETLKLVEKVSTDPSLLTMIAA